MNKQIILAVLMLSVGIVIGYQIAPVEHISEVQKGPAQPLFYRHPMNPEISSPVPAKDDMGMDYIPVYAEQDKADTKIPGVVKIDAETVQNMGVRTAEVQKTSLSHLVQAVGRVAYDEERLVRLHPKIEGWIEQLKVDKTGQRVAKNTDLLSIYSPQLVATQQEYLLALNNLAMLKNSPIVEIRQGAEDLLASSLQRLKFLDVPKHQLQELTQSKKIKKNLHIHAPAGGIVMNIGAREGQYVTPATELYMIADLSKVWVYADIYEYELPWIKQGDQVEMQLAGIPGRVFKGELAYIYPYAEAKTRTIKVRIVFDNADLLLKPDMFAKLTIYADQQNEVLAIPAEAVIRSGASHQVFVMRAPGKFEPRAVILGLASAGQVVVLDGLDVGEKVVTSAQFLIDSESKLREATAKMLAAPKSNSKISMDMEKRQHD